MDAIEHLDIALRTMAGLVRLSLEILSVLCVLVGLLSVLRQISPSLFHPRRPHRHATSIRLTFGTWLSMALEFQLGADIVSTTTAPTGSNLIQLAAVALIRTFLNVFLAREIEAEQKLEQEQRLRESAGPSGSPVV